MRKIFNPLYEHQPSELEDVLFGHEIQDSTLEDLKVINELAFVSSDFNGNEFVQFLDGGYSNIVIGAAISSIQKKEPARVTLKIIEIYDINSFLNYSDKIKNLQILADKEIEQLSIFSAVPVSPTTLMTPKVPVTKAAKHTHGNPTFLSLTTGGSIHLLDKNLPNLDYINNIWSLMCSGILPSSVFFLSSNTKICYPLNKQSSAVASLVVPETKFGINLNTGNIDLINNKLTFDLLFLLNSANWFKNAKTWREEGMSPEMEEKISNNLSLLVESRISLTSVDLSQDEILAVSDLVNN